ncbi:MAG: arginine N-succinyltransferase [Francisellaceae bacterium]|jgi:arginine N-succinyltransferase|nr:arginine N-succinyltransferase [Francisellaceae bacterium]MBT6208298.1 arginine N-succinyltransferase [Francisellaceae bacterium]MBT6538655.1 arginine N-succinyltransferase [Francisellaceae bacterium]
MISSETFLVRPVRANDFGQIWDLANEIGYGFTSFPKDNAFVEAKIQRAVNSFAGIEKEEPLYLLVLEDISTGKMIGFSGIEAKIGKASPFYNFKINTVCQVCESLGKSIEHKTLHMVNNFQGASELVSLYLHPKFRGHRRGECLSRSRFMLMAMFAENFNEKVIAEIRGVSDKNGQSPFWDCICSKFFDIDFIEADLLSATTNKQFISDLLPREPIYIDLLKDEAANVIGVPHVESHRAMNLLEQEGFYFNDYIDIFDGGPVVQADLGNIKTVNATKQVVVSNIVNSVNEKMIVASHQDEFALTLACGKQNHINEVTLDNISADLLKVAIGDYVYILNMD